MCSGRGGSLPRGAAGKTQVCARSWVRGRALMGSDHYHIVGISQHSLEAGGLGDAGTETQAVLWE